MAKKEKLIDGVVLTPLKQIDNPKGDIYHGIKASSKEFHGFGEMYFSLIKLNERKGWKKHTKMISNLIVPQGEVKFYLYDDRANSPTKGLFNEIKLSPKNYYCLTVPNNIWMAFEGISDGMVVNFANIEHDPAEAITLDLFDPYIPYAWEKNK